MGPVSFRTSTHASEARIESSVSSQPGEMTYMDQLVICRW
jgi:hypothetical protein